MGTNTRVDINAALLDIPWAIGSTYSISIEANFVKEDGGEEQPSPAVPTVLSFTGTAPTLVSTSPAAGSSGTVNNAFVQWTFSKAMIPGGGNIRLYKLGTGGAADTLLRTYTTPDFTFPNNSPFIGILKGNVVRISVAGLLIADATYYLLTDANTFVDSDGFAFAAYTNANGYYYTTATAATFRELIGLLVNSGTLSLPLISRTRRVASALASTSSLTTGAAAKVQFQAALAVTASRMAIIGVIKKFTVTTPTTSTLSVTFTRIKSYSANINSTSSLASNSGKLFTTEAVLASTVTMIPVVTKAKIAGANLASSFTIVVNADETQVVAFSASTTMSTQGVVIRRITRSLSSSTSMLVRPLVYYTDGPQFIINDPVISATNAFASGGNYNSGIIVNSTRVFVTDTNETTSGNLKSGQIHAFNLQTQSLDYSITNPTLIANTEFGSNFAVSDSYVAAANIFDSGVTASNVVHIFSTTDGSFLRTITDPNPPSEPLPSVSTGFGSNMQISGNNLYISSPNKPRVAEPDIYIQTGQVHIFNITNGSFLGTIEFPSTPPDKNFFGRYLHANGTNLAITRLAFTDATYTSNPGPSVYVYSTSTGNITRTFDIPAGLSKAAPSGDDVEFGLFSRVQGNYAVIPSYQEDVVRVYNISTGALLYTITNSDFTWGVATNSNFIYVQGVNNGYLYNITNGNLVYTFTTITSTSKVSMTDTWLVVQDGSTSTPSVYVYRLA